MILLALAAALLAGFVWLGRRPGRARDEIRILWTLVSVASAAAAVLVGLRGGWMFSLALVGLSAYVGRLAARRGRPPARPPLDGGMSDREARAVLGVAPGASRDDIEQAYRDMMRRAHPDHGGSAGLAAQINAARDRLLR